MPLCISDCRDEAALSRDLGKPGQLLVHLRLFCSDTDLALLRRRDMELPSTVRRPSIAMPGASSCSMAAGPSQSLVGQRTRFAITSRTDRDPSTYTAPAQSFKKAHRQGVRRRSHAGPVGDIDAASGPSTSLSDCSLGTTELVRLRAADRRMRKRPRPQTTESFGSARAKELKESEEGWNTTGKFARRHGREDDGAGKKVLRVGELMNRLTLRFQDVGLEADYQAARKKEIRRYRTVYRVSLVILLIFCSIDICYRGTQALRMPNRSAVELLAIAVPHLPFLLLLCATFTDRLFIDNFEGTVSALILTFIFAKCISDYYTVSLLRRAIPRVTRQGHNIARLSGVPGSPREPAVAVERNKCLSCCFVQWRVRECAQGVLGTDILCLTSCAICGVALRGAVVVSGLRHEFRRSCCFETRKGNQ